LKDTFGWAFLSHFGQNSHSGIIFVLDGNTWAAITERFLLYSQQPFNHATLQSLCMKSLPCFLVCLTAFQGLLLAQIDITLPVLICKTLPATYIGNTCLATAWATDLIESVTDDNGPIELGLRVKCTGDGFPNQNSITTGYGGTGIVHTELWAKDPAGNTAYCNIELLVQDNLGICDPTYYIQSRAVWDTYSDSVYFNHFATNCFSDTIQEDYLTLHGNYIGFGSGIIPDNTGYDFTLTPRKNISPLNGVTTYDLALISKHILGLKPITDPYKMMTADVNQDGKITTFDIVLLRQLILGAIPSLPHGKSWQFVPQDHVFLNPENPFVPAIPEAIILPRTTYPTPNYFQFLAVKIGDVNFSADPAH